MRKIDCPTHGVVPCVSVEAVEICTTYLTQAIERSDMKRYIKSKDIRDRAVEFIKLVKRARMHFRRKEHYVLF